MSYSKVKQYVTCGEQYRLERIEQVESQPGTAAIGGRIIHSATEAIDHLLVAGEADYEALTLAWQEAAAIATTDQLEELKDGRYTRPDSWKVYGKQDLNWYINQGIPDACTSYLDWRLEGDWDLMVMPSGEPAIEVEFKSLLASSEDNELWVRGYIDRVFISTKTGAPLILDLKSGVKPKNDVQLGVYKFALEEMFPGQYFSWGAYLYGMKKGGTLTNFINLQHWTVQKLIQVYAPATEGIERQIFVPNPGEACFHCGVAQQCAFYQSTTF
jgi:hypothetical protein